VYKMAELEGFTVTEEKKRYEIEVEKCVNTQLLLMHGCEDDASPAEQWMKVIVRRLEENARTNYRVLSFPQTGHFIELAYTPPIRMSNAKFLGGFVDWGGTAKPQSEAAMTMWRETQCFLRQQLDPLSLSSSDKLLLEQHTATGTPTSKL